MRHALNLAAVTCLVAAMAAGASAVDIAGNGGFESGSGTDADIWLEFAGGGILSTSERDSSNPASGSFAARLFSEGSALAGGGFAVVTQNTNDSVGGTLVPGTPVTASFDWEAAYGVGGVGFGALRILAGDGTIVADTGLVGLPAQPYAPIVLPGLVVPAFGAAPFDKYNAFLEIVVNSGGVDGSTALGFVDNCGLGLITRRRR